ncbi:MAG: MBL fold metallo-hydrolase [Syntrophomonadaceae bacterium]|nr:MBL fold metallo-hydrolase [Syntrophomonadaceae bacterium]
MQINILASGSTGNAVLVQTGSTKILVDVGISNRRIEKGLAELGIRISDLGGILITHEHSDHINGLDVLVRKYRVPVYTRSLTWQKISCTENLPAECVKEIDGHFNLGEIEIDPFSISHDAADPVVFCFYHGRQKMVIATDLGIVTPTIEKALAYADLMVLESNHDIDMLKNGPYPQVLKQRIRSSRGHLSNWQAAQVLARIPYKIGAKVMLAHLSQQNNHPVIAEQTVREVLSDAGIIVGKEILLYPTFPARTVSQVI